MGEPLSLRMGFLRRLAVAFYFPWPFVAFVLFWLACALDRAVPVPLPFPRHPRALAKKRAWVERTLKLAQALPPDATITGCTVTPFKEGEVFRSTLAILDLTYTTPGAGPRTLLVVAKFAAQFGSVTEQVISIFQRNALNETQLARALGTGTAFSATMPRCYYARAAGLAGQFCELFERIAPVFQIEEETGADLPTARAVMRLFARHHAAHWRPDERAPRAKVPMKVPGLAIDFLCSLAWGRHRKILRRIARAAWHYGNRAQTIVHGDARVRNVLFQGTSDPSRPLLIDWQATRWGLGVYDVAYFLLLSLPSELRDAHERELVELYHQELVAHGVAGYDRDALWEDYRHSFMLVTSLLFLPLLGGEQTLDERNRAAATSIAVCWHARVVHALGTFDRDWVTAHYATDIERFVVSSAWIANHPHPWNSGARLVADELRRRARQTEQAGRERVPESD